MKWNKAKFIYPSGHIAETFVYGVPFSIKNCFCRQGLITLYYNGFEVDSHTVSGHEEYKIYLASREIELQAGIESSIDRAFDNLFGYDWRAVCKQYPNKGSRARESNAA